MKATLTAPNKPFETTAFEKVNILDTVTENDFGEITQLAALLCNAPIAFITLTDEIKQHFKVRQEASVGDMAFDFLFCLHTMQQQEIMLIPDASKDVRFFDCAVVTNEPGILFYAGATLLNEAGKAMGTLSVIDQKNNTLDSTQLLSLKVLAKQVQTLLNLRLKSAETNISIKASNKPTNRTEIYEKSFRFALEKIGDNVWEYDYRTSKAFFSKKTDEFIGYDSAKIEDYEKLWWNSMHKDDLHILQNNDKRLRAGEVDNHNIEYRIIHSDGSIRWVLDRAVVIEKDSAGKPLKIIGTHTDITSAKNTAAALKESEKRWKFALEGSGDGIWDWNAATGKVFFSNYWKKMLGFNEDEIKDNFTEWESRLHPDDVEHALKDLQNYLSGKSPAFHNEHRLLCKDGSYKWILTRGMVIERTEDNKPARVVGTHTDIHQNKAMEIALEHSVKQFQGLSENIPGVIFEYESKPDGTEGFRYLSPAMEKVFGIKPQDFFTTSNYIHPEDQQLIKDSFNHSVATLEPYYNESRLVLPDNRIVWRSTSCSFSYFTTDGAKVFTGLMLDISERKKATEKLSDSENRLSSLISNMQTGILVEDEEQQIVLTNQLFCSMFGITSHPHLLKGKKFAVSAIHSSKLIKKPAVFADRIDELREKKKLAVNDIIEMNDGRIFSRDYVPVYQDNIYKGHLWKYNDVTEQKNAESSLRIREEKYRSIIANMNLGLMEVDTEEKIVFANQSFCDMCGYDLEELVGKKGSQIFIKGDHIEMMESKNEARKKNSSNAYEAVIKNKRGELRWWLISGAPRYNDNGELMGSIGIHLDITDQKQLEIDLIDAREEAEGSTRSKEVFLANMSHEIRTPLNAILGMSNQLSKTSLDSKQFFYLDVIKSSSENLLVIINDILDLSKIEAGKLSLEKIGFEPKAVIKRAMQVLIHKAEEKGLSLTNSCFDEKISPVLLGDPYRLNQILLNIISNAIKFTEKGSVDIMCTVLKNDPVNQTLLIAVKDSGIGMDEHFVKNLFEKFSQEDASVTRQYGGTGLGMSICKDLIELMGGKIQAESKKGMGTNISFKVILPKGDMDDLASKETFVADAGMLAGRKILVVDDNEMNRLVATTILTSYGATTMEANNGKESIDYLLSHNVDLVLMDIQMPVMNGMEATNIIRKEISNSLPVIALTANAIKGDINKYIASGMNDYVAKPFKEEDLLKVIASWLKTETIFERKEDKAAPLAEEKLYDISSILEISRGNNDFVNKMLKMFADQTPAHVAEMRTKYSEKDFIGMGEVAHRIKPTIDNMGIGCLKETIREIEKTGKGGLDNSSLPALLQKVEDGINNAIAAIKKDFQLV